LFAGCSHTNSPNTNNVPVASVPACQPTIAAGGDSNAINLTGVQGDQCISTTSGSITIRGARGQLNLTTVNGSVTISGLDGSVGITTVSGSVTIDGYLHGQNAIRTDNGSVTLRLGGGTNLAVDVATVNGSISNDFGLAVRGNRLQGRIGDGSGGSLTVQTGSGSVTLQK
jgi:DUF4097 and DUF4098 domain-containing protein YvlB